MSTRLVGGREAAAGRWPGRAGLRAVAYACVGVRPPPLAAGRWVRPAAQRAADLHPRLPHPVGVPRRDHVRPRAVNLTERRDSSSRSAAYRNARVAQNALQGEPPTAEAATDQLQQFNVSRGDPLHGRVDMGGALRVRGDPRIACSRALEGRHPGEDDRQRRR